jgi:putative transposase
MQYIKGSFSFRLKDKLDVWQRSYTNHRITGPDDYTTHVTYIHQNPVEEHRAPEPHLYPYSSATPYPLDPPPTHLR